MGQVERKPDEPRLVGIILFLLGDPVDCIGGFHYRRKGGRRDAGQGPDGRLFGTVLIRRGSVILDMIVVFKICVETAMEIAQEEIETCLFWLHAWVYTQTR